jgi:hypothetical protein
MFGVLPGLMFGVEICGDIALCGYECHCHEYFPKHAGGRSRVCAEEQCKICSEIEDCSEISFRAE